MSYFLDEILIFSVIESARRRTDVNEKIWVSGRGHFWVVRGAWPLSKFRPCVPAMSPPCFSAANVLPRVCEWLNSKQVFFSLRLLNTGFVPFDEFAFGVWSA